MREVSGQLSYVINTEHESSGKDDFKYCGGGALPFFVVPWTVACQAPLSMEFSRQE